MNKIKNLFIICFIFLLMGCAKETETLDKKEENVSIVFENKTKAVEEPEEDIVYVKINKFSFEPATIDIDVGTTVVWENVDDYQHFIRTVGSGFQSPLLKPGEKFNLTFDITHKSYKYVEPNFGSLGYINVE